MNPRQYFLFVITAIIALAASVPILATGDEAYQRVTVSEGTVDLPAYEFVGRETQPTLFGTSSLQGKYPFAPFIQEFKPGGPQPASWKAVFVENEYLKLTYLPEFGGRFFSLYDKVRGCEVFYRNDVMKPANYNMKHGFPLFGIELTGPYDSHAITLYGEPYWFHRAVSHEDGSVELVLGNIDPVYRMKVNFSARIYPGTAAMQLKVSCYNRRDSRKPYMFWISGALRAQPETRFIYPMTRTIGHTTSEVAGWPDYDGVDYSWDRNHRHMLGVFGIDIFDNFQGAYHHGQDYGVFRWGDRKVVQGMKMWTFGYSDHATNIERAYTDNAGPYIEVQSGRYVWDGHYEWLQPHKTVGWTEWWMPVSGIGGLTTMSRDAALNLNVEPVAGAVGSSIKLGISSNRQLSAARVKVVAACGEILNEKINLAPGKPYVRELKGIDADSAGLAQMRVTLTDSAGAIVLDYARPDEDPGKKEYTPFTRQLDKPRKPLNEMGTQELVLSAEFYLKQMKTATALERLNRALEIDPGESGAHLHLGLYSYEHASLDKAIYHFNKVIERDPYQDQAYYYLAQCYLELEDTTRAERNLYYIPPVSSYFGQREYLLGRLAFIRGEIDLAGEKLVSAVKHQGLHRMASWMLALIERGRGDTDAAIAHIADIEDADPTSRLALAERYFNDRKPGRLAQLVRMTGGQAQEALELAWDYSLLGLYRDALEIMEQVGLEPNDPWGTPAIYYYTRAWLMERTGRPEEAADNRAAGMAAGENIDRFVFRPESEGPLSEALAENQSDSLAAFYLGCLKYHLGKTDQAINTWERLVASAPGSFAGRRALGLAYSENGHGPDKAAGQLEAATVLCPSHLGTVNDLSNLYARSNRFEEQVSMLERSLERTPGDDDLTENLVGAYLATGLYADAEQLMLSHSFSPRHRRYGLRNKYRYLRYGLGARAYNRADYPEALRQFRLALELPVSLGVDNFQFQSTPRANYYLGLALEALGQKDEARNMYEQAISGAKMLSVDRDSWNSENVHMAFAFNRMGQAGERDKLLDSMDSFARSQLESRSLNYRAEARYLLALVLKARGEKAEYRELLTEALQLRPDLLGPRLELAGDVPSRTAD